MRTVFKSLCIIAISLTSASVLSAESSLPEIDSLVGTYNGMGDFSSGLSDMASSHNVSCTVEIKKDKSGFYSARLLNNEAQLNTYSQEIGSLEKSQLTKSDNGMTLRFDAPNNDAVTVLSINNASHLFKVELTRGKRIGGSSAVCGHLLKASD